MTDELFADTLRTLRKRVPFKPFVIWLETGQQIEVDDPDSIGFQGVGTAVHIDPDFRPTLFDACYVDRVADCLGLDIV